MSGEAIYCRNTFRDVAISKSKEDLLQLLLQSQKLKSKTPLDGAGVERSLRPTRHGNMEIKAGLYDR